ncbi:MAG: glycosyltransferase [Candidatus Aenigmarchaeota archaeon]|nr:glycosyltransferase [Candidatus Aenigmarchaeota archaeon]
MKIAIFTDSYKPQINGLVRSLELFNKELRKKGHKIYIIAPKVPDYKDKEKGIFRTSSVELESYKEYRIAFPFRTVIDFPIKADVIHVQSPFSMGLAGLAVAKSKKIPTIGTFHTMFSEYLHYFFSKRLLKSKRFKKMLKKGLWKYLIWFYNRCDVVIAPTEEIKKMLIKRGLKSEIVVIPTGVVLSKTTKSKEIIREKYGFSINDKILLHVGRITKEKNIEFIINSLKSLLKDNKHKLIITSDGPYKNQLIKMAEKTGIKNILFTGYIDEGKLNDYYRLSDLFVMASKTETQGLVLLEAVNNQLPVVVLDAPVISGFVKENKIGLVAKKTDFLSKVKEMEDKSKVFMKNFKSVSEKYDIRKCANDLENIYKELQSQ